MSTASANYLVSEKLLHGRHPKKTAVVLLRWVLIITCSALVLFHDYEQGEHGIAHLFVIVLILSNLCLAALPAKFFVAPLFDHLLIFTDIVLVTGGIALTGQAGSEMYLLYFLIIMIAAVGETLKAILASATLVSLVYLAVVLRFEGAAVVLQPTELIRIPFFFVVALFYGYFAQRVRSERKEKTEYQKELSDTTRIREVMNELTSSLDRAHILETLVARALAFAEAEYCAVVSLGSRRILYEAGDPAICSESRRTALLLNSIRSTIEHVCAEPELTSEEQAEEGKTLKRKTCFQNHSLTCLPFNSSYESDLYLCLLGEMTPKLIEHLNLILFTTVMALNNAGQYQATLQEVEKRREMIEQLGSALKFKSEFAANITHEVRTPIYSFIGFAELLVAGGYGRLTEEQERVIGRMLENSQSLLEMVNNILENAKLDSGEYTLKPRAGRIDEFIEEVSAVCSSLLKDKPVSLDVSIVPGLPPLITDWTVLRQIAINLVSNAIKFTRRGRVEISAGYESKEQQLWLRVSDTGVGIPEDKIQQIFEPYRQLENSYTKKYAGTGLGLAISKKQVEILGGSITVQSKEHAGSQFTVVFPVHPSDLESQTSRAIKLYDPSTPVSA